MKSKKNISVNKTNKPNLTDKNRHSFSLLENYNGRFSLNLISLENVSRNSRLINNTRNEIQHFT